MSERPLVLCVDDEPDVLEGLELTLHRRYRVLKSASGQDALSLLSRTTDVAIVISDMRMPGMNGAEFLKRVRSAAPDAVRLLLTGQADLESAIAAVNEGFIFRFLTKPCPAPSLLVICDAAMAQYRLVLAERELLEQTLRGSIAALTDILALSNPVAFGRAARLRQLVSDISRHLQLGETWPLEVAAMFSQLGMVAMPVETAERIYDGRPLSAAERGMVARTPVVIEQLLGHIPRLELVREVLHRCGLHERAGLEPGDPRRPVVIALASVLRAAIDFDAVTGQGHDAGWAIVAMRERPNPHDVAVLDALTALHAAASVREVRETRLSSLAPGDELADDIRNDAGTLIVPRGYLVTDSFLERVRNFPTGTNNRMVRVVVREEHG